MTNGKLCATRLLFTSRFAYMLEIHQQLAQKQMLSRLLWDSVETVGENILNRSTVVNGPSASVESFPTSDS